MKTATGFEVHRPRELLIGFIRSWFLMYDGVAVREDNELRIMEIALSTMLNSRISGNTGGAIWQDARTQVAEALAAIPSGIDLLDVKGELPIPGEKGLSQAVDAICKVPRSKLSVATKILHKKRPGIIPIFDSVVERHYWPHVRSSVRGHTWGDYAVVLTSWFRKDMLSVGSELRELREELQKNGTPLTAGRILNALMWVVGSKNEPYYRRAGNAEGNSQK